MNESASRDVIGPLRPREDDLVYVDGLTGLCNQRLLSEMLDEKFAELVSLTGSFALVMIDLDLFKDVNDRYGHLSGDEVLRVTGELLRDTFRESDLIFRYGGDEFVVLLPGATAAEAETLGRRAREAMQKHEFFDPEEKERIDVPLSFSIGVAAYPVDGETGRAVLGSADARLYDEKKTLLTARRRKKVFTIGTVVAVFVILITIAMVVFLDRQPEEVVRPLVMLEPPVVPSAPAESGEREALLSEIAELQRQIESLRTSRAEASSSGRGGPEIRDLELKVAELTEQLKVQSDMGSEEPPSVQPERSTPPSVVGEPARRPPAPAVTDPSSVPERIVLVPPRLKERVIPTYPSFAMERGIEATIELEILVDESGRVSEATVLGKPVGFGFEDAARRAALSSEWSPATRDGKPVPMKTTLQVRFQIAR